MRSRGIAATGASYEGTLSADDKHIAGILTAPNRPPAPVDFARTEASAERMAPKRPQTPQPPFPYKAEEVAFVALGEGAEGGGVALEELGEEALV